MAPKTTDELSKTLLVACDLSYAADGHLDVLGQSGHMYTRSGSPLAAFPDTRLLPYSPRFLHESGWYVDHRFFDPATGYKYVAFRSNAAGNNSVVIAFGGTDGPDWQDWDQNLKFGWEQWDRNRAELFKYLDSVRVLNGVKEIHFTGQSLGGGLAELAAYQWIARAKTEEVSASLKATTTLTTFNGFGTNQILSQKVRGFDDTLLRDLKMSAAYYVTNDLVSRLGGGHPGVVQYNLDFRSNVTNASTGEKYHLDPVDAHRIEPGFYAHIAYPIDFDSKARRIPNDPINTTNLQPIAALWSRAFSNRELGPGDGKYMVPALMGVIQGVLQGPEPEVRELALALYQSVDRTGAFDRLPGDSTATLAKKKFREAAVVGAGGSILLFKRSRPFASQVMGNLFAAAVDASLRGRQLISEAFKNAMNIDVSLAEHASIELLQQAEAALAVVSQLYGDDSPTASAITALDIDLEEYAAVVFAGDSEWKSKSLRFLVDAINDSSGTESVRGALIADVVSKVGLSVIRAARGNPEIHTLSVAEIADFVREEIATAGAEVFADRVRTGTASIRFEGLDTYEAQSRFASALVGGLVRFRDALAASLADEGAAEQLYASIDQAIENVQSAGESVVIAQGNQRVGATDGRFDPGSTVAAVGSIDELGGAVLTLVLPIAAGADGQRVLLSTVGQDKDKLRLNTGVEVPNVNGTFMVTVPDGTRELVLAFSQHGDLDSVSVIDLKAQLVDVDGNPTHKEHLEATLTLHGVAEPQGLEVPGPTSTTVLGDRQYQEFTDIVNANGGLTGSGFHPFVPRGPFEAHYWTSPGFTYPEDWVKLNITDAAYSIDGSSYDEESGITTISFTVTNYTVVHNQLDDLGNIITNATPEPDQADNLYGSDGADLIDAGGGDDNVEAKEGDDTVYVGSGADDVDAGAGDDWVEGGGDNDYLYGEAGNDRLIGGGGFDFLSGDVSRNYVVNRGFVPDASTQLQGEDVLEGGASTMDMLIGGGGRDSLYANVRVDIDQAIDDGDTVSGSGERGDWLAGGAGDDVVVGAAENDALFGGSGGDLIVAGAGDDHVNADQSYISEYFDWLITEEISTVSNETLYTYHYGVVFSDGDTGVAGDDRIYTGTGADIVDAGGGDDFVDAGSGNDKVWGHAGGDIILGGEGDDLLQGDNSASILSADQHGGDFIDGGAGNDDIKGDGGNDALYGGDGDDILQGDTIGVVGGDDYLNGEAGNDTLSGIGGADVLIGGAGDDELFGDSDDTPLAEQGNDELIGGEGNDRLQGYAGDDHLDGGAGHDQAYGGAGADRLIGGDGNDQLFGEDGTGLGDGGNDTILAGLGDDQIRGEGGNDSIDGGGGADVIGGDGGNDTIYGGLGNDQLVGGEGDDALWGEGGDDVLFGEAGADQIDAGTGNDQVDAGEGTDRVAGGDGDDTLLGGGDNDELLGDEGDDILLGGDGFDFLDGGAGRDHMQGGAGIDTYVWDLGSGEDTVADDLYNVVRFGPGITRDFLSLGVGSLLIRVGGENALHIEGFNPQDPYAEIGIGELQFTDFDGNVVDTMTWSELIDLGFDLVGTPNPDFIAGTGAADRIFGLEAQDWLQGGEGNDEIYGGEGDDTILGGEGADTAYGEDGDDNIEGGAGRDTVYGDAGDDVLSLGEGDDVADGGEGNDTLAGDEGADVLQGGSGNDDLSGDAGDDELVGGEGADVLRGGAGADALTGGLDDDTYVLEDGLDAVAENADEGVDAIVAAFDYALGAGTANVENLVLAEGSAAVSATGDAAGNFIGGNENDNLLYGLDGDDVLEGSAGHDLLDGGAGADVMFGGLGDDAYLVDSAEDVVQEQFDVYEREFVDDGSGYISYGYLVASGGYDSVESSVTFVLDRWTEALVLTGSDAIDGTGNVEANFLQGNDADNALYAYRLNGEADTYPWLGTIIQQFTGPRNAAQEMLHDKANAAIFRAEFGWFAPLQVDLNAGAGDELVGLGGNDRLYGGLDDDSLYGGDGDDLLYGFAGSDHMAGGAGDDRYVVSGAYSFGVSYFGGDYVTYWDEGTDELVEAENEGVDTVYSEVDFALPDNFENLTLVFDTRDFDPDAQVSRLRFGRVGARVGEGNALDNVITANDGGNELYGHEGNDTLVGGAGRDYLDGGEGIDSMTGGANDDEYNLDAPGDLVIELAGGGHDLVYAHFDYTLTDNVEDLYLGGETYTENLSGTGNELDNRIEGNDGHNVLLGLGGNDVLVGGWGDDVMEGGTGDDTYHVDSELDVTSELGGDGHDTVYSSVGHTLGDELEDLYLTGADDIWGEGNAQANLIVGNEGGNWLAGYGGGDVLRGEDGGDQLEGGEGDDQLLGGAGGDSLTGGEGSDLLDGGYDDDTMAGGLGDDTYYVDSDFDVVLELEAEGIDTVYESVWYYTIGENVENAAMLGDFQDQVEVPGYSIQGNALDNEITGNDNENWLYGNEGHDTIDGRARDDYLRGGIGDDTLYGGDDAIRHELLYMDDFGNIYGWDDGGLKPVGIGESELASNTDDLEGGEGNDSLDGGSGDDRLYGGQGNDYLYGGDDGLIADYAEYGGGGEEEGGGGVGQTDDGREFLRNEDDLRGGAGDDVLDGGSDDDRLFGEDGADTLLGGADGPLNRSNDDYLDGGAGIDFMAGGTGSDTYVVDGFFTETTGIEVYDDCGDLVPGAVTRVWTTDTVVEVANEGYDRVWSFADYTLPEHVEELTLWWSASDARIGRGNAGDNYLEGNSYANRLEGGAGDDTLVGEGGDDVLDGAAGDDRLYGGPGNNTFLFGAGYGLDTIFSGGGGGTDRVHLAHGIAPSDVTLIRQGDDVVISLGGGDSMRLEGWFIQPTDRVRQILFCDDPAWDEAAIAALISGEAEPVGAQDDFAGVQEDGLQQASGNVLDNDFGGGATLTVADPGVFEGYYGTLELQADGSFTYTLDNEDAQVQSIPQGEMWQDYFWYQAVGEYGARAGASLIVDIAGANDAPVLDSGADGAITEDAGDVWRFADGQLLVNGGFESGFDGWSWEGNQEFYGLNSLPSEGSMAAFFGAVGTPTLLSQAVETMAGERYLLEFMLMGGTGAGAEVQVTWNGETLLTVSDAGQQFGYRQYQVVLDGIDVESHLELALRNDAGFWHLDDVRLGLLQEFESVSEFQEADGALRFTDVDYSDWHGLSVQPQGGDYLGELDAYIAWDSWYGQEGRIEWSFSVANEDLQFLAEGETREQVYDLTLADPFGGTDTKSVTVTLRGVNDAFEIEDDWISLSEDDVLAVSGNVFDNDYELDLADALTVVEPGSFAGTYGTLDLAADGSFTYTLDNDSAAVQALNAGEVVGESFEYTATDGYASNLPMLFVDITGMNDAPIAQDDAASVQEDGVLVAAGNVLDNDSDADAGSEIVVTNPGVYAGAYGSLTLGADGAYVYTLDNALAQPLAGGQEIEEVFAYDVTDGTETASAALTVTVAGANDVPEVDDLAAVASEDGPGVTLTPVYSDADAGGVQSLAVGAYGNAGFEQGGFAGWQVSDAALAEVLAGGAPLGGRYASLRSGAGQDAYTLLSRQFTLAAGESLSGLAEFVAGDALPYDDDGYVAVRRLGGASTLLFGASVTSAGDYGTTGWTPFEFVAPEAGTYVLEAGVRNAQDNSVDSRLNLDGVDQFGPAAGVTLNADGTIGYDPGGRFEWLAQGETATEAFSLVVTDDQGAQALASATVQIVGANDAPEIGDGDTSASVLEDNGQPGSAELGAQGALAFTDVDLSDVHQVQLGTLDSGYLGAFTAQLAVDTTGGGEGSVQWSFSIANAELDALGEGETLVQSYEVLVEDAFGGSAERVVTITLAGVNDGPSAVDDAAAVQEDGVLVATGNVLANDTDADANDILSVADVGSRAGAWGTLQLFADGSYLYELDNDAAQALRAGQEVEERFAYTATDGLASASAYLTVTVTGLNDAPRVVDDAALVQEDGALSAEGNVLGNDTDVDAGTALSVTNAGTYAGGFGTLTLLPDGTYSYLLDNARVQFLAEGQNATDIFAYSATDGIDNRTGVLTVTIAGTNDAPVTVDDAADVVEDLVLAASGNVLANDSDPDSGTTLTVENAGQYGSLALAQNGEFTYTLDNASAGVQGLRGGEEVFDQFAYLASDGLASTPGTLAVRVVGTNDDPFAVDDAGAAQEDGGPVTLPSALLLANDTDADFGDAKTLIAVTNSATGAQVMLAGTDVVYDIGALFQSLKEGATAPDSFAYTMADAVGVESAATVLMTIIGVNDAPVLAAPLADQDAAAGTPFAFTFAPDTFTDVDIDDSLGYAASLADGSALPAWLQFNAATRTFSGTPPGGTGGGTGDDCGCGIDGGGAPATLAIRVTAMDTAGASASDDFVLNIAGGSGGDVIVPIVGTSGNDVLSGTSGDDVIDGRTGYDQMSGGAGDDVYFVDLTCTRDGHKGNEGLGNGEDPPPPGHDSNWNDGPGTWPGNPGSKGGQHGGGGRGDDRCRVDLVVEGAVAGYDTVYSSASYALPANVEELHLIGHEDLEGRGNALANMLIGNSGDNRLYGLAGHDLLLDDAGHDLLDGGDGNDVLDGGRGNDALAGGKGNDLFVHALGGGHDVVRESGGQDAVRFGAGIAAGDVTAWRHGDNLVLSLAGGAESVTVKDWFSWSAKRVERVEFADGTAWNEDEIRERVAQSGAEGGNSYSDPLPQGCVNGGEDGHDDDHHDDGDGGHENGGGLFDAIAARLKQSPDYDFTALAAYLQRQGGGGYGAMTPEQIANRWVKVQQCVASLAPSGEDCGGGYGGYGNYGYGCGDGDWGGGWGHSGSTGQNGSCGGMGTFSGLGEGFQKL